MESSLAEFNQRIYTPNGPVIPILGMYPREIHTQPKVDIYEDCYLFFFSFFKLQLTFSILVSHV